MPTEVTNRIKALMPHMKTAISLLLAVASVCVFGAGCNFFQSAAEKFGQQTASNLIEKSVEKVTGNKVDVNVYKNGVALKDVKTGQTFQAGENIQIPDNFPADAPRYAGAAVKSATVNGTAKEATAMLETGDKLDKVEAWYKDEAVKAGWKSTKSFNASLIRTMGFEKDENGGKATLTITLSSTSADGKTTIIVNRNGGGK
jgi:hypothetical protein